MKSNILAYSIAAIFALGACNNPEPKEKVAAEETVLVEEPAINVDETVANINAARTAIEAKIETITPKEVSTKDLRAQISQKWSKLHFYADGDNVIRIKSYPYENISKRTEEFYFDNTGLILVVIEDDGSGDKGKSPEEIDKMYYFNNGVLISELNNTSEKETAIRQSEGEHLMQEANEYLEIYKAN